MKKIVHKSAAPLYAAAVVWVLYALVFPLYRIIHFAIVAVASAVVYLIAKSLCKDIVEEVPEEPAKPETTGNEALDKMIAEGNMAIAEMKRLNDSIEDASISAKIDRLEAIAGRIFRLIENEPAKKAKAATFLNYYLPTTQKLLDFYAQLEAQPVQSQTIRDSRKNIEGIMDNLVRGFENQLDSLFRADALDISSDISVLENMLAQDGLNALPGEDAIAAAARGTAIRRPAPPVPPTGSAATAVATMPLEN